MFNAKRFQSSGWNSVDCTLCLKKSRKWVYKRGFMRRRELPFVNISCWTLRRWAEECMETLVVCRCLWSICHSIDQNKHVTTSMLACCHYTKAKTGIENNSSLWIKPHWFLLYGTYTNVPPTALCMKWTSCGLSLEFWCSRATPNKHQVMLKQCRLFSIMSWRWP